MEELDVNQYIREWKQKYEFKEYSDDDTYALRDLKIISHSQNKLLWSFIIALGIPDTIEAKRAVFCYFSGRYKTIANPYIFLCREKMRPSKWYYKINEELPERISFTPKYDVENLMHKESVGHLKLEELQKFYTMPVFAQKYGLNLYQIKNIRYRRFNPLTSKKCFKIFPPASVIIKLRDIINPDYWYVFPEELN